MQPLSDFTRTSVMTMQGAGCVAARCRAESLATAKAKNKDVADDIVTIGDENVQLFLYKHLPRTLPDGSKIAFSGEEKMPEERLPQPHRVEEAEADYRWKVDPIDGTKQYGKVGTHYYSVSAALQEKMPSGWQTVAGYVYCASPKDTKTSSEGRVFWAERDVDGAYMLEGDAPEVQRLKKPAVISHRAEFEVSPLPVEDGDPAFRVKSAEILAENDLEPEWRRSIIYAMMEVLTGETAAVAHGPGPRGHDIAASGFIKEKAGAHVSCEPTGYFDHDGEQLYTALTTWDKPLFDAMHAARSPNAATMALGMTKTTNLRNI